jgi:death-on-curing protein
MTGGAFPRFLVLDEVLRIHADQIAHYGGALGVRDEGGLVSAIAQPEVAFDGHRLHDTLAAQAAAYLFHLVKNHAFVDGNKRVGTAAALVFLDLNGYELDPRLDEEDGPSSHTRLESVVLRVACGEMSKAALTLFIGEHLRPCED